VTNDVAKQNTRRDAEDAFFGVELPFVSIESFHGSIKVVDQGIGYPNFYDDIVDVGFDEVIVYLIMEALLDSTLVCGPCIFLTQNTWLCNNMR
jgi:hypothetical protein